MVRGKWWMAGVVDLLGGPNVPPSLKVVVVAMALVFARSPLIGVALRDVKPLIKTDWKISVDGLRSF